MEDINQPLSSEELNEILQVRREKLAALREQGADPFEIVRFEQTHHSKEILAGYDALEGKQVSIAGRMLSKRVMGKASFAHILDGDGRIQIYVKRDDIGEEAYDAFKSTDIGDIIGVSGYVFKTRSEEISVHAQQVTLLSKSLLPLPEKFHGLKDTDMRYRQRYVDLIVNPDVRDTFIKRSLIIREIRRYLDALGFIEVETPVLQTSAGGAAARPFITHHNTLDMDMFLRIATELHLKRLIVGGFERVYEIGRIFRNEGISYKHNPEFTTIELYQAYTDYHGMMELTENLIAHAAKSVLGTTKISYQGEEVDLTPPFKRQTMLEAVREHAGVDLAPLNDEQAREQAKQMGLEFKKDATRGEILNLIFEERVEDKLLSPTFIMDYPIEVSPLTKRKKGEDGLTERFELFITRREIANAYSELNDPVDQKERLLLQAAQRSAGDEEANMMDDDFVTALEYGMPPTGGMGMGIDRLVMLLTDCSSIRDVLLFPTMKPKDNK